LKALLPESKADIKGRMRSIEELRDVSGYTDRPDDFADLIRVLDTELRLITPVDPEGSIEPDVPAPAAGGQHYQLTHDYLVHSLRDWLTRKQRETRRGRAELLLEERAALWKARPENRRLPSAWEWANIRLLTRKRDWTDPQRRMMKRAGRVQELRGFLLLLLLAAGIVTGLAAANRALEDRQATHAAGLVRGLLSAETGQVPEFLAGMQDYRRWVDQPLRDAFHQAVEGSRQRLHASLALLSVDPGQADYLANRLLEASPIELPVIWRILTEHHQARVEPYWATVNDPQADPDRQFRAACALAISDAGQAEKGWDTIAPLLTDRFLAAVINNPSYYSPLIETLRPIRKHLLTPLASIFRNPGRSESERTFATTLLADYAADNPDLLAELLMDADPKAFVKLFPVAERQAVKALPRFQAEIAKGWISGKGEESERLKDALAERQARAAVALVRLGHADEVWPRLQHSDDPRLRCFLINWLNPLGADPKAVAAEFGRLESSRRHVERGEGGRRPDEGSAMESILFHKETSMRRALILALGTYKAEGLSPGEREPLIAKLLDLYQNDPDAGIHGATEWTLRQWAQQTRLLEVDAKLPKFQDRGNRRWYVNGQGQTFALVERPVEFLMGSPLSEPDRSIHETPHRRFIRRPFAIAAKEVTVAQYQRFAKYNPPFDFAQQYLDKYSADPNGPMIGVSWFGAAAYCNWLSQQEGLPEDQWCYLPNEKRQYDKGMTVPADTLQRSGYRLPTEAEWEYACRAGAATSRSYGLSVNLLESYAQYQANSKDHAWMCGSLFPNDLGLFDMLGNVFEWCQDRSRSYQPGKADPAIDDIVDDLPRLLRGGSFSNTPALVRSAIRGGGAPTNRNFYDGFRPARTYN
jgi:formylglycine-generating enzyme required for sulfatase activity